MFYFNVRDIQRQLFKGVVAAVYSKQTPAQVFACKYCETFKNRCFIEHLRWLLLQEFYKKLLGKISKISLEHIFIGVLFIKLQVYNLQLCENRGPGTGAPGRQEVIRNINVLEIRNSSQKVLMCELHLTNCLKQLVNSDQSLAAIDQ